MKGEQILAVDCEIQLRVESPDLLKTRRKKETNAHTQLCVKQVCVKMQKQHLSTADAEYNSSEEKRKVCS